jgi:hypothetical protein
MRHLPLLSILILLPSAAVAEKGQSIMFGDPDPVRRKQVRNRPGRKRTSCASSCAATWTRSRVNYSSAMPSSSVTGWNVSHRAFPETVLHAFCGPLNTGQLRSPV